MKILIACDEGITVRMSREEFKGVTGFDVHNGRYRGYSKPELSHEESVNKVFDIKGMIEAVNNVRLVAELKMSMAKQFESAKEHVSKACWPAEIIDNKAKGVK